MVAIKDMEIPKNCVECNHMDLQQAINCQLIYSGCANCGRHPNCPLVEIGTCKDCTHLGVMDCKYYCKLNHWGKISKEGNYGGMGDFYCSDFERRE